MNMKKFPLLVLLLVTAGAAAGGLVSTDALVASGALKPATVYDVKGTPTIYLDDGGVIQLDQFPCAWRPKKGVGCLMLLSDGGTTTPGEETTLQAGQWVGSGCLRKACVMMLGGP